jgi:predicted nucleic acid-binding protein
MSQHYFDANPLMRWAEAQAASASERSTTASQRVEELLAAGATVAISEITLIEFHDNVCAYRRNNKPGDHDDEWLQKTQTEVMNWIADGRLSVLAPVFHMVETAMSYITLAQSRGQALRAWDAVHLCRATEWAHETGGKVTIVTGDADFGKFLGLFPKLGDFVAIETIGTSDPS